MKQKTKTHKSSTISLQQAQQNLAAATVAFACHPDVEPETAAWLRQFIQTLENRAQPSADSATPATATPGALNAHDCMRLTDDTMMVLVSESTDDEIAQALAHLLDQINAQKAGVRDALGHCIDRCYTWSQDFRTRVNAFAQYKLTTEA